MKRRSNAYWRRRADERMANYHRSADQTVQTITTAYDKAITDLTADIDRMFEKFTRDGMITADEARLFLNEPLPRAEWDRLKLEVYSIKDEVLRRRVLSRLNAPAYAARITRLQALREQAYLKAKIIADVEIAASTAAYMDIIKDAYYRNMFDIQQGLGLGFNFAQLSESKLETILKRPWSGRHFSSRIWGNTDELARQIGDIISSGAMSGQSLRKMRLQLEEVTEAGKHAANRLIRTETTYMANAAEMESYEEAEIDKYQFLATLDNRTSEICRKHDLKVFKVENAEPGKNMPPLHPYCRSTTVAYFGKKSLEGIERRARDPKTGKNMLVPADMSYGDWKREYVRGDDEPDVPILSESDFKEKSQQIMGATNLKEQAGEENYNRFVGHLGTVNDERTQKLYEVYGKKLTYTKVEGSKAFARGASVQLTQDSFDGNNYSNPLRTVYHENGHAFDHLGLQALKGKTLVPTGKKIKKKVLRKTVEVDEMISHASGLPEYKLKETIDRDLWVYVNGKELPMYSDLGDKPRKKTEKEAWENKRMEIYDKSKANFRKFEETMIEKYGRGSRQIAAISDIYESTSFTSSSYPFGIGHGKDYYKKVGMAETEFFAHVSETITTDKESYELIKEIFPNSVATWERIVDDIVEVGEAR